jgi:AcrR family transcriptional regulator
LTGLATADKRRARSERTREKLLDAAMACYRKNGIGGTAMEDVAQQAGVGRATLYRHFANQEALLADVMAHNLAQMQALMSTSIQDCTLPEEFFVETALVIINECYKRGLNTILFSDSTSNSVVSRISFSDPTLTAMGDDLIGPFYQHAKEEGILRDWVTKPLLQEWTSRLMLSFLTNPSPRLNSDRKLRKFFYEAVMPSIINRP